MSCILNSKELNYIDKVILALERLLVQANDDESFYVYSTIVALREIRDSYSSELYRRF